MFELSAAYQLSVFDWIIAALAALLIGLGKAGIKGLTVIIVSILALVFGSKASTGIMLPLLIFGDIIAVIYYHRHTQWKYLFRLLPWMMAGVIIGTIAGKDVPEFWFKRGMAIIILISVVMMYWWERKQVKTVPDNLWFSGSMGLIAGFTTMVGNLAGAFANIFFLAMRLPKNQFIGTAAWLFFMINLFKVPFHIFSWETIHWQSFTVNLYLFPAVAVGMIIGIELVKYIKSDHYRYFVLGVTAIGAVLIFFK